MLDFFRFVWCWNLLHFMNWVWGFCDLLLLLCLGLVLLAWISNCCLCGQVWSYRSQNLFLIKEIQMGRMRFRTSYFFFFFGSKLIFDLVIGISIVFCYNQWIFTLRNLDIWVRDEIHPLSKIEGQKLRQILN